MVKHTPETRSTNLFHYFGWQGGTIHQIAQETGVDVQTLLYSERENDESWYARGAVANETCDLPFRLELAKKHKGDRNYWIGVAKAIL